jgi:Flp pilus assembly protein TadG
MISRRFSRLPEKTGLNPKLLTDSRGSAAVEFAVIAPLMLMIFFGTIEVSTGVAVDRKVGIVARTLSDLTSQANTITTSQLSGIFAAAAAVLMPYYSATDYKAKISEIKIDASGIAKIAWGTATPNETPRSAGDPTPTLPAGLKIANTYLIWGEVSYTYRPPIWYNLLGGQAQPTFTLADNFYTRPRQSTCVLYNTSSCP